jgi:Acetyltransferase (GNAT) domain
MNISVRLYAPEDQNVWDAFCAKGVQATLLHTRLFLAYHKERFFDRSLVIEVDGKVVGLFPAALQLTDDQVIVSHPGATYGGIIHQGMLQGERMLAALKEICNFYAKTGYKKIIYKAIPFFYQAPPMQDDIYGLFRLHAKRFRCDLSCTIDLQHPLRISERRKRALKKAQKAGVSIVEGHQNLESLWDILKDNLIRKHAVSPVHSLEEIKDLMGRFPENIRCIAASESGQIVAGTIIFVTPTSFHAQYIASSMQGYDSSALDLVFNHAILSAKECGRRWFDFGISTENGGLDLNDGLFRFKSEFGAGSTVHEFYEIDLGVKES